MKTLAFLLCLFITPAFANGNHEKNSHHKKEEPQSQGSKSNSKKWAVLGILGVAAIITFGPNSKKEPEVRVQVREN